MRAPDLSSVLERHHHDPTRLVQILRDVQDAAGFISPQIITELAGSLGLPRARVEGVAGFYFFFATSPQGEYRVLFSHNVTDEMLGSAALLERMCDAFGVTPGVVSEDGRVSVDLTSCTGLCDQGPALLVNGRAIGRLTEDRIDSIVELVRSQAPLASWPKELFCVDDNVYRKDMLLSAPAQASAPASASAGDAVRAALQRGPEATLEEIKQSGHRGRGGAGYSVGLKWEAARRAPGPTRFVVCNADEGEPGTFKDRVLLSSRLDLVLDGMTVCAFAIGAQKGFLYLRGEYLFLKAPIEAALAARRTSRLLGRDVLGRRGFDFDIDLHLGAGAYICGEESALIESLEGERGIPRNRPPFPVTHGYLHQPTVVNNVETLAGAALIAKHGATWYRSRGTAKSPGTKVLSVSGDCERPGVYEYPLGVTVKQVLDEAGAKDTQAAQVGGPAGVLLSQSELNRRLCYEELLGSGSIMIFDTRRDMLDVATNFARFFAHESCGFCTPCRVGTTLLKRSLNALAGGTGTRKDLKDALRISRLLKDASHCGLGQSACNPMLDLYAKFKPTIERRLSTLEIQPTFDLDEALAPARELTGRDDALAHLEDA